MVHMKRQITGRFRKLYRNVCVDNKDNSVVSFHESLVSRQSTGYDKI